MTQFTRREAQRLGLGLLVFLATNCSMGRAPGRLATRVAGPPFWRVRQGGTQVTLFGFGDARDTAWLSPALQRAFEESGELWLETAPPAAQPPPDLARVARFSNLEGRTLFEVLGPSLSARVRARLAEYGVAEAAVATLRPWRAYYAINGAYWRKHPPADPQQPVDAALFAMARAAGKTVSYEFAGFGDFAEFMGSMPDAAQRQYVRWLLDYLDEREQVGTDSYGWIEGRRPVRSLERMAALPELFAALQGRRNRWWAETIRDLLAEGRSAFVAVGQLHVMGASGIPAQLATMGIEAVPA